MRPQSPYQFPFARYPAVRLLLLFAAGIVLGNYIEVSVWILAIAVVNLGSIYLFLDYRQSKAMDPRLKRVAVGCYMVLLIVSGCLHYSYRIEQDREETKIEELEYVGRWEKMEFSGKVLHITTHKSRLSTVMQVDSVRWDSLILPYRFRMRASGDVAEVSYLNALQLGDRVRLQATVYPVEGPRNPHQFDYLSYLKGDNIAIAAGIESIERIRPPTDNWSWIRLRRHIHGLIEDNFSEERRPLAKAILIGDKGELADPVKQSFSRAGLAHIMAVSGMHVGFLVAPLWLLIPWCWRYRWGKVAGLGGIILVLLLYAGITGFSASVVRASLMAVLLAYGKIYHRRRQSVNLAAVAALVLLAVDPQFLFDIGFQLSFAAVFTILLVWPLIDRQFASRRRSHWWHGPVKLFLLSLLVQVALLPLLARFFGEVSLVGPLVNMVVMAGMGILIQWGLLCLVLTSLWSSMGIWLNMPVDLFLGYIQQGVQWSAGLPGSFISIQNTHPLWSVLWGLILCAVAAVDRPALRWKWWIAVLTVVVIWQVESVWQRWSSADLLKVTVFDVGQGDAILVRTPDSKTILIDAGRWTPDYNSGDRIIIPYLEAEGVDTLHAVILSHPHADHIGGLDAILRKFPVRAIYHSGINYDSGLYNRIRQLATDKNVEVEIARPGRNIPLDSSVRGYFLGPSLQGKIRVSDVNDASVILQLAYGEHRFLFMGDAGRDQEKQLLELYGGMRDSILRSDFLKVGHHGSNTSSSNAFLKKVRPSVSVASLAWKNRYRHPHQEAVNRLLEWTSDTLHFTSRDRAVIYVSDGRQLRFVDWENRHF